MCCIKQSFRRKRIFVFSFSYSSSQQFFINIRSFSIFPTIHASINLSILLTSIRLSIYHFIYLSPHLGFFIAINEAGSRSPLYRDNPVSGSTKPVLGSTKPVLSSTKPVLGSTKPVLGSTIPILDSAKPVSSCPLPNRFHPALYQNRFLPSLY